ncbi:DUF1801 domain-containing protein [Microbacterium sp. KUDC0406]|uniref:DUF1801 domain-containing protein n=1 Tax=Microbacterium sp. KUDC0406 TaxID=2909588 RepID=UPI001F415F24|nr:DUF1801 domain-containing protein [Microbacterium sp. KUDC0406]UJP09890.1 DUF1801 domain-containing protein [Microbacterium sp. KUDC0406]
MKPTGGSVATFLASVTPAKRRRDAETLTALLQDVSGREPELWGTIVGFGSCHYRYATGTEGDMPLLAFAPRKAASTIYLESTAEHADALTRLGAHTTGVGCLYIKDLEEVDLDVLRDIVTAYLRWGENGGSEGAVITVTG